MTPEQFRKWVRGKIDKKPYITPSALVLLSFYQVEVIKPQTVTAKLFDYLRSITESEIKIYKSKNLNQ